MIYNALGRFVYFALIIDWFSVEVLSLGERKTETAKYFRINRVTRDPWF
jgi:hypothetical protein